MKNTLLKSFTLIANIAFLSNSCFADETLARKIACYSGLPASRISWGFVLGDTVALRGTSAGRNGVFVYTKEMIYFCNFNRKRPAPHLAFHFKRNDGGLSFLSYDTHPREAVTSIDGQSIMIGRNTTSNLQASLPNATECDEHLGDPEAEKTLDQEIISVMTNEPGIFEGKMNKRISRPRAVAACTVVPGPVGKASKSLFKKLEQAKSTPTNSSIQKTGLRAR